MFVKTQRKLTFMDNFAESIQVEKDFETKSSCLEEEEDLMESDMERIISKLKDEITNMKKKKGEGKKPIKKKISTNTSLEVPLTPRMILDNYALDNFYHTHGAHHSEKTDN